MGACNYNCPDLPPHEQIDCGDYQKGGVSAIGILECDHLITDFTSASQTNDAITSGKLTIIQGIKGQIPEPAPIEVESRVGCGPDTDLDGFNRTATWKDFNVVDTNVTFYNELNKRKSFLIVYNCNDDEDDDGKITVIEASTSFVAHKMLPELNGESQMWNVVAKWTKFDESPTFDAPADIYN